MPVTIKASPPAIKSAKKALLVDVKTGKIKMVSDDTFKKALLQDSNVTVANHLGGTMTSVPVSIEETVTSKKIPALNKGKKDQSASVTSNKPMCNVGVQARHTMNLGNFNSVTMGVSVNIPCSQGELNDMFDFAKLWVDQKMQTLVKEIEEAKE